MSASVTGTPAVITWAAGATPAGQSITVPAGCTAVYLFWTYWNSGAGEGLLSATLNGAGYNQAVEAAATASTTATGACVFYNPSAGSQTLQVVWDAAPADGPSTIVVFVTGGDTTSWRSALTAAAVATAANSVTLTTVAGDLVLAFDSTNTGTAPGTPAGFTSLGTQIVTNESVRASWIAAAGTSQVCPSQDLNYATMIGIAIPAGGGGGSAFPPPFKPSPMIPIMVQ
jgi:hypothetical protein